MKRTVNKDLQDVNKIPDYDNIFRETKKEKDPDSKVILGILKKRIPTILLSVLMFTVKHLPVLLTPFITSMVIDEVTSGEADVVKIIILAVIFAITVFQNCFTHPIYAKITDKMLRNISAGVKATVVRKLQRLSITYHKEIESGKLQSKFLKDTESIDAYVRLMVCTLFTTIIQLLIAIGMALYRSPIIVIFFIIVIPANILLTRFFSKSISSNTRQLREETETLSAKLTQMLEMLQVTKAHGLEDYEIHSIERNINNVTQKGLLVDKTLAKFGSASWVTAQLFSGLCLFFSVTLTLLGVPGFTAGSIVLFQSLFSSINGNVTTLINSYPQIATGKEAIHSVSEIMNSEDIENNLNKAHVQKVEGNIKFDNVCYRYPNSNEDMIKNFNLEVKKGECIALVGSSGSGKSTIMNMIIGFLKPTSGALYIDDKNIEDIDLADYRHSISVVPQNSILFEGTIRENITYGLQKYTEQDLLRVIEMANVNEFLKELPNGLDTNVGEHGGKLSGGQRQRITIARALIRNPSIFILDEATSALDNVSEYHVQKAIEQIVSTHTTFIVAHRLSTIRNADRIIVMENGKMIEIGTYDELIAKKGKFYELKNLNDIATKTMEE